MTVNLDWFLKDAGLDVKSDTMKKARKFVLDNGGIENAQLMTKYKLAAFGQYEWILPYVPLFIFKNYEPYTYFYIKGSPWVM